MAASAAPLTMDHAADPAPPVTSPTSTIVVSAATSCDALAVTLHEQLHSVVDDEEVAAALAPSSLELLTGTLMDTLVVNDDRDTAPAETGPLAHAVGPASAPHDAGQQTATTTMPSPTLGRPISPTRSLVERYQTFMAQMGEPITPGW